MTTLRAVFFVTVGILATAPAAAHVRDASGSWYFDGSTYNDERTERKDPVNVIFKGGDSQASIPRVINHIADHAGWRASCGGAQRMVWRGPGSSETSDKQDMQEASGAYGVVVDCFEIPRYHFRGWDDHEHDDLTASHGEKDQWVVGGVHHDQPVIHDNDRDWDISRRFMVEDMAGHCSYPKWRRHLGAKGWFGDFFNSGWIARISMRHSPGCDGA